MVKQMKAAQKAARKAIEATYFGTLTVTEHQTVKDEKTKLTKSVDVVVLQDEPCRLSFEKMYDCLEYITTDGDTKPIRGSEMNHQVVNGVLNFFVNYDFFTVKTEDNTPMETMTASTDVKEGG